MPLRELTPITAGRIDIDAAKVVRRLVRHGYEAYLVGGCVRDLLVARRPKDFDVSTSATPTEIKKIFRNCRIIGRRFRLAHIFFGRKIIEVSTFRAPPTAGEAEDPLIWRDNVFGTAEEDARRRDFTINGLFYDLVEHNVIDSVDGLADLRAGLVRTIGEPDLRFREDPVRMLRAIKFAARLGFTVESATEEALIAHRGLISRCSVARVLEEVYRLLGGGSALAAFELAHHTGVLAVLFPELARILGPPADARARRSVPVIYPARRRKPPEESDGEDAPTPAPAPLPPEPEIDVPDIAAEAERVEALLVTMSLATEASQADAAQRMREQLTALDQMATKLEAEPSHAVLLGALLGCLVEHALIDDERRIGWTVEQVDTMIEGIAPRLQVSRRDKERLRRILVAQRRLHHRRPHSQAAQREYFAEAFALLQLRGADPELLERWQQLQTGGDGKRKRRRRRRGGRGGGGGDGQREPGDAVDAPLTPNEANGDGAGLGEGARAKSGRRRRRRRPATPRSE